MNKLVNASSTTPGTEPASILRRSIVLKLTLFVGILVSVTAGTLITVGYLYTSMMLSDQIDARLSAAAEDRQGLLRSRLAHLDERVRLIANRTRFRDLLDRHARGVITPEAFGAGAARIFDDVRTGWSESGSRPIPARLWPRVESRLWWQGLPAPTGRGFPWRQILQWSSCPRRSETRSPPCSRQKPAPGLVSG
jgi:hypothetical protein